MKNYTRIVESACKKHEDSGYKRHIVMKYYKKSFYSLIIRTLKLANFFQTHRINCQN